MKLDPFFKLWLLGAAGIVAILAVALMLAALLGCSSTRSTSVSTERTVGIQAGQPTDLTTTRREQEQTETSVDVGPAVQAAVAAATGDIRGALKVLTERPPEGGMDMETGGALGAAGGLGILFLREFLAHRRTQRSDDEGWEKAHANALKVPPEG